MWDVKISKTVFPLEIGNDILFLKNYEVWTFPGKILIMPFV